MARQHTGYEAFVHSVAEAGGFSAEQAEQYIVAVIATLEARLSFTEVSELEAELPLVLRDILHGEPILDLPGMDENELFARVRARLGVSIEQARIICRIVLHELRARISPAEAASVEAQLSPGLKALWRTGSSHGAEARPR
jgi:uncharacterized protein (DUF2267 family)